MRKLYLASAGVIVTIVVMSTSATAVGPTQFAQIHGSICQPQSAGIVYSQYGVHNVNQPGMAGTGGVGTATVICPLPLTVPLSGATVGGVTLNYYDRGSATRVSCTVQGVDVSGNLIYMEEHTSPSGGADSGLQTFNFAPMPVNPAQHRMFAICSLPPRNGAVFSHITGFNVALQLP